MFDGMGTARYGWGLLGGLGFFAAACVETAGAERIVGPDGTQMLHVHCADEQVACFQIAGERCPHGYDLSPIFDPHDGNFLVRCRNAAPLRSAIPIDARASAPRTVEQARTAEQRWTPVEVATPTEPWPTPSSSALPPTPRTPSGALDIGY
jgi:hypothetical protein